MPELKLFQLDPPFVVLKTPPPVVPALAKGAKAKKKKKRQAEIGELISPQAQKKAEREVRRQLDEIDELAEERYAYACKILQANGPEIQTVVDRMVTTLQRMQGRPRFIVDGIPVNIEPEIIDRINKKLHTWVAVRLLVAGALWDIRIAGLKLPKKACARCGKKVK